MKQFFKFMFASMLGVFLTMVVLFFILLGIAVSVVSSQKEEVVIKENSVLLIKLDLPINDRSSNNPMENFDFMTLKSNVAPGLNDILENIKKAKTDDKIKGIYMELGGVPSGIATVEEVRNALLDFRESGKFILCYAENYSQKTYYLATVADSIYLNPEGSLDFKGLTAEVMFLKGALKKLDIEPQIVRHGKFKSAIEPLILDKMSEANKEQTLAFISAIWEQLLNGISERRKITKEELNKIADHYSVRNAKDAVTYHFVDMLSYKDQVLATLHRKLGTKETQKINFVSLSKYTNAPAKKEKKLGKNKIAVIYASGDIVSGAGDDKTIGSTRISEAIRKARMDSTIKAIVLRVNSPGGSSLASEVIWREVVLAKAVKPVVASMGNLAASGGYYISCAADTIIANPNTITGSIGVFGIVPNLQKLFNNKLGITFDKVKTNEYADYISTTRPLTANEKEILQTNVEEVYQTFIHHVAEGRHMNTAQVDSIGQGRVWSGVDAKRIGLIDDFGGLEKAIKIAAFMAKLDNYRVVSLPAQKDPFTQIIEELSGGAEETFLQKKLGDRYIYYKYLNTMNTYQGIQARLPFEITIY